MLTVYLYRVGRNINRAIRTCSAFGVESLALVDCPDDWTAGRLYAGADRVSVSSIASLPVACLALDMRRGAPVWEIDWSAHGCLVLGGETSGIPARLLPHATWARIPSRGELTVEAALAIALYARERALFR